MPTRQAVEIFLLSANLTVPPGTTYPNLTRVDSIKFPVPYVLVGLHFASTLVSTTKQTGFAVVCGQETAQIRVSQAIKMVASNFSGATDAVSKSTWANFGEYGIRIPANSPISLYATGDADPARPLSGIISLRLVPAE